MSNLRLLSPTALLVVALAACGPVTASDAPAGSGEPSASITPASAAPGASASASTGASASPSASATASASAAASASASAATDGVDVATLVPTTVGDVTLSVTETDAQAYIGANVNRQLAPILVALGKTPADVTVATATGSATGGATLFIDAVRIDGADAEALVAAFQTAATAVPGAEVTESDTNGKPGVTLTTGSYTLAVTASGDTLFYVQSPDAALVAQGLTAVAA